MIEIYYAFSPCEANSDLCKPCIRHHIVALWATVAEWLTSNHCMFESRWECRILLSCEVTVKLTCGGPVVVPRYPSVSQKLSRISEILPGMAPWVFLYQLENLHMTEPVAATYIAKTNNIQNNTHRQTSIPQCRHKRWALTYFISNSFRRLRHWTIIVNVKGMFLIANPKQAAP